METQASRAGPSKNKNVSSSPRPLLLLTLVFLLELARQVALDKGGLACFGGGFGFDWFRKEKKKEGERSRLRKRKEKGEKKETLRDRGINRTTLLSSLPRNPWSCPLLYRTPSLSLRPRESPLSLPLSAPPSLREQAAPRERKNKKVNVDASPFFRSSSSTSPIYLCRRRRPARA